MKMAATMTVVHAAVRSGEIPGAVAVAGTRRRREALVAGQTPEQVFTRAAADGTFGFTALAPGRWWIRQLPRDTAE